MNDIINSTHSIISFAGYLLVAKDLLKALIVSMLEDNNKTKQGDADDDRE